MQNLKQEILILIKMLSYSLTKGQQYVFWANKHVTAYLAVFLCPKPQKVLLSVCFHGQLNMKCYIQITLSVHTHSTAIHNTKYQFSFLQISIEEYSYKL